MLSRFTVLTIPHRGLSPRDASRLLAVAVCLSLLACSLGLGGCRRSEVDKAGPVEIAVWHPWGGDLGKSLQRVVDRYHQSQDRVRVRLVFNPTDLSTNQKFFTAIAANKPPDAVFVDGTQDGQWAEWGALIPLDEYIKRDGIRPTDYYAPCWNQALYRGNVWSLTYCADPNFAFVWNRDVFRRAGLDPNRAPRTIDEMDRMANAVTRDRNGRLEVLGLIPWNQYGLANSMFTWGWAFGGTFFDEATQTITANHPDNVRALEWMVGYASRLGITRINSAASGWGDQANDPFVTGKLGMRCLHLSTLRDLERYAPNLDYGMAPIPGMPDGEIGSSWVGGWSMALPKGSPHPEEAWDFIRWICATDEGTLAVYEETGSLPGYRSSPAIRKVKDDPRLAMFAQILEDAKHQRPTMPAQAFYMGALDRAVSRALYGRQTPKEALDQATQETQRELDLILGRRVR